MNKSLSSSYCLIGYRYLQKQLDKIDANINKIKLNRSIEYLHKSRVASRRLRSALTIFKSCMVSRKYNTIFSETKHFTRSLSVARDLDVQIQLLREIFKKNKLKKYNPGIKSVLMYKKYLRKNHQEKLDKSIIRFNNKNFSNNYNKLFKDKYDGLRLYKKDAEQTLKKSEIRKFIKNKIKQILSLSMSVKDENNIDELHRLRIKIKKLRYAIEIILPFFKEKFEKKIIVLKKLQDILGSIHDFDVWLDFLPKYINEEIQIPSRNTDFCIQTGKIKPGIDFLYSYSFKMRSRLFKKFLKEWEKVLAENYWEDLLKI